MLVLIKTQFLILNSKIKRFFDNKGWIFVGILCIVYFLIIIVINYFSIKDLRLWNIILNKYIFFILLYFCITYFPIEVYKSFIHNKEFDLLFLSPISLFECFTWNFLKHILGVMFPIIIIYSMLIPTLGFLHISRFYYLVRIIIIILFFSLVYISLELILHIFTKSNIYQVILFVIGIQEIITFFIIGSIVQGNIPYINEMKIEIITENFNLRGYGYIIILFLILYIIAYKLFEKSYYINGVGYKNIKNKSKRIGRINNSSYLFWLFKDEKVFFRDFDRLKYISVTIIIYIISVFSSKNKVGAHSVYIVLLSFILISGLQITIENIFSEKEKKDIFILSPISITDFIIHKFKFSLLNTLIVNLIYGLAVVIFNILKTVEIIELSITLIALLINSVFIYMNRITVFCFVLWSDLTILKKNKLCIKIILSLAAEIIILLFLFTIIYFLKIPFYFKSTILCLTGILYFSININRCNKFCNKGFKCGGKSDE